jgi:hypothetical protein
MEMIPMRINNYFLGLSPARLLGLAAFGLLTSGNLAVQAQHASGGGTYFVGPRIRSEFQFNQAHVQCKIGHAVMPDGTVMQMFMFSTSVDSVTIDRATKTVTLTGSMVSMVNLRSPDGTTITMSEAVPYTANAKDSSTPGAGGDFFSITVVYDPKAPGPNQFAMFGSPATFAGTVVTGNVTFK